MNKKTICLIGLASFTSLIIYNSIIKDIGKSHAHKNYEQGNSFSALIYAEELADNKKLSADEYFNIYEPAIKNKNGRAITNYAGALIQEASASGNKKDIHKSIVLFRDAAVAGWPIAIEMLAYVYLGKDPYTKGAYKDDETGYFWGQATSMCKGKSTSVSNSLLEIEKRLPKSKIKSIKKQSKSWTTYYCPFGDDPYRTKYEVSM